MIRALFLPRLRAGLSRFWRADSGSQSVEAVLVAPMVLFAIVFCYSYFAAFEAKSRANKAAYTISDYISRQTAAVDQDFIDGMADIYRFLNNDGDVGLRVTTVVFTTAENPDGEYKIVWSAVSGTGYTALAEGDEAVILDRLPYLAQGQQMVVIETTRNWESVFNTRLAEVSFSDFVTTTPRFAPQVVWETPDAPAS